MPLSAGTLPPAPSFLGSASILAEQQAGWEEDENLSGCGHRVFNTPFMGPGTAPSGIISFCPSGDRWEMGVENFKEGKTAPASQAWGPPTSQAAGTLAPQVREAATL